MFFYQVYGLCLGSDFPLSEFPDRHGGQLAADIRLCHGAPQHTYERCISLGFNVSPQQPVDFEWPKRGMLLSNACYHVAYPNGLEVIVDGLGAAIYILNADPFEFEDFPVYLSGPLLGFALRLRGSLCLHASVIDLGGYAIALMAPSGGGKSTTAAAFARRGFRVMSDDVLVLTPGAGGESLAHTGVPWVRLCEDALKELGRASWRGQGQSHLGNKRRVQINQGEQALNALPLRAIYSAVNLDADLAISNISGAKALLGLLGNLFRGPSYQLPHSRRTDELKQLRQLLAAVPLRGLAYRRKLSDLPSLCDALISDSRNLQAASAVSKMQNE